MLAATGRRIIATTDLGEAGINFGEAELTIDSGLTKLEVVDDATQSEQLVRTAAITS